MIGSPFISFNDTPFTTELESQQQALLEEMETLNGMIQQMIRQNAAVVQDQTEYNRRFETLSQKFKDAEAKKAADTADENLKAVNAETAAKANAAAAQAEQEEEQKKQQEGV